MFGYMVKVRIYGNMSVSMVTSLLPKLKLINGWVCLNINPKNKSTINLAGQL